MSYKSCKCKDFKKATKNNKIRRNFTFFGSWLSFLNKPLGQGETIYTCPFCSKNLDYKND